MASAVFSGSSDALHTVGDTKVTPDSFAVILGHQWSSGNLKLGWDLVDVTVGLSPSGDLSNGASWVFFVGNGDGRDLKIWNLIFHSVSSNIYSNFLRIRIVDSLLNLL